LRDTFPDLQLTCRATHHGALLGFPATDRQVTYVLFDHLRLNGGKMVERWGMPDALGLLLQVGLTVPQA